MAKFKIDYAQFENIISSISTEKDNFNNYLYDLNNEIKEIQDSNSWVGQDKDNFVSRINSEYILRLNTINNKLDLMIEYFKKVLSEYKALDEKYSSIKIC